MLRQFWRWIKGLLRRLWGNSPSVESSVVEVQSLRLRKRRGERDTGGHGEGTFAVSSSMTDSEYESLLMELLQGVDDGWSRGSAREFLAAKGVENDGFVEWLRVFGERLLAGDGVHGKLGRRMVLLGDLDIGELSRVAGDVGVRLLRKGEEGEENVFSLENEDAHRWFEEGNRKLDVDDFAGAVASYDKAIQIKPDNDAAWNNRGAILCEHLRNYEEAIASYDKALQFKPDNDVAWYNRGVALNNLGRDEEALASYDKALQFKPDNDAAWYNRGVALNNLGRDEEALASFDKALQIKPDNDAAWYNRGLALGNLGRDEEALASFDKAIQFKPDYHEAWGNRGFALVNLGRYEEAIASYDKAIQFKPDYDAAWYGRGIALVNLGRYEEAIASYDKALEIKPDFPEALTNRGLMLDSLGFHKEALESFECALAINPNFPEVFNAWNGRGFALLYLGRDEDAIASFDKAIQFKSDFHLAWINRGVAAGHLISCDPFLSAISSIARQHPHLNQRGYEGKLICYEEGLKHCPQETHPEGWGKLHQAIGKAHYYQARNISHPRSYRNKAVNSYTQALTTLTATDYPEAHLEVLRDLIHVYFDLGETTKAAELRRQGTDLLRRLLDECQSPAKKRQLALKFVSFQQFTVDITVQSGNWCAALELAETGKNTCLSWLLDNGGEVSPTWKEIQQLLSPTTAIVYWHLSPAAQHTFILKHNSPSPIVLTANRSPIHELESWVSKWNQQYANSRKSKDEPVPQEQNWRDNLPQLLEQLAQLLNIPDIIQSIQNPKSKIQNLILIPHRDLHRFPLHALFPDNLTTTYLPSAQIGLSLAELSRRQQTNSPNKLLSIEHPDSTAPEGKSFPLLFNAEIESAAITRIFPHCQRLADNHATKDNLISALQSGHDIFHFTGHGTYDFHNPQTSALALSGEDRLTLTDILQLSLNNYRLVSLSACETAVTGNQTITTEYVGLVSAFLFQGVSHVVSTLWTVSDDASSFVMIYFYWQLSKGKSPQIALKKSTKWLQNLTYKKLEKIYQLIIDNLPIDDPMLPLVKRKLNGIKRNKNDQQKQEKPFAHPYNWAGFTITGLIL